jgi:endonuclease YncB( thermonuclease family)
VTKLRLLCVDTEEKLAVNAVSASKPGTVFGEECAKWAQDFFAAQAQDGAKPRVGLYFPAGREQLDSYGRTLCHLILQDGRDFNLLLVEEGKSPYFNKYGNSPVAHELFVAAQERARAKQKGIWNPATNVPKTDGAPSARRPYELLIPWWNARAAAIEEFRARERKDPRGVAEAENPASLKAAAERGGEVDVFGTVDKTFDEPNGDWTLLLRCEAKDGALRVRIPKDKRARFAKLDLEHVNAEDRQNYLWVRGKLGKGERGLALLLEDASQLRIAKPEPVLPKAEPAGR